MDNWNPKRDDPTFYRDAWIGGFSLVILVALCVWYAL